MDERFDKVYLLKAEPNTLEQIKQICIDYGICDNGVFENAANFHFSWGFGPNGIIYISPTTFLYREPDFNSIKDFIDFLNKRLLHIQA